MEILNEKINSLKQISSTDSNADNSWSIAKSSYSRRLTNYDLLRKNIQLTSKFIFVKKLRMNLLNAWYSLVQNILCSIFCPIV